MAIFRDQRSLILRPADKIPCNKDSLLFELPSFPQRQALLDLSTIPIAPSYSLRVQRQKVGRALKMASVTTIFPSRDRKEEVEAILQLIQL
jgi:hypothetical protein